MHRGRLFALRLPNRGHSSGQTRRYARSHADRDALARREVTRWDGRCFRTLLKPRSPAHLGRVPRCCAHRLFPEAESHHGPLSALGEAHRTVRPWERSFGSLEQYCEGIPSKSASSTALPLLLQHGGSSFRADQHLQPAGTCSARKPASSRRKRLEAVASWTSDAGIVRGDRDPKGLSALLTYRVQRPPTLKPSRT